MSARRAPVAGGATLPARPTAGRGTVDRGRLTAILESVSEAILDVDRHGRDRFRNEAYGRFVADRTFEVSGDGQVTEPELRARLARGDRFRFELLRADETGVRRWFEATALPARDASGAPDGGMLVIREVTDRILRRRQEESLAVVVHELRTPLTALRGYLQLLVRATGEAGSGDSHDGIALLAAEQTGRLARLLDELFDVARADAGVFTVHRERVDLCGLVERTVALARSLSATHELRLDRPADPVTVEADTARLQQLVLNLVSNAIVHAPESPDIEVRVRSLRRYAQLEVEDHGPGIPESVRIDLFSRFQRRPGGRHGLGLGLYIARRIVEAHGGTIRLLATGRAGTTFVVRLPLAQPG